MHNIATTTTTLTVLPTKPSPAGTCGFQDNHLVCNGTATVLQQGGCHFFPILLSIWGVTLLVFAICDDHLQIGTDIFHNSVKTNSFACKSERERPYALFSSLCVPYLLHAMLAKLCSFATDSVTHTHTHTRKQKQITQQQKITSIRV